MINCILINNDINDNVLEIKVKNLTEETIYKKCNFKNSKDFNKIKEWVIEDNNIELWGKINGNKNLKNNWNFFNKENLNIYGKSIFIMKNSDDVYISLSKDYLYSKIILLKENNITCEDNDNDNVNNNYDNVNNENNNNNVNNTVNNNNINNNDNNNNDDNNDDNNDINEDDNESIVSNYSYNSELSYELYSYSDDDTD